MDTVRPNVAPNLRPEANAASGRPWQSLGWDGTAAPEAAAPRLTVKAARRKHLGWLEARTGAVLTRQARGIEAVDAWGKVWGMVAYDNWTTNSVQAHMAVVAPLVWRRLLPAVFRYPFEEAGRGVLLGIIPAHNARSVRMVRRLGFRLAHEVLDGWAPGDSLLCFELRREDCKWLREDVRRG